jgi:hypothetical protein
MTQLQVFHSFKKRHCPSHWPEQATSNNANKQITVWERHAQCVGTPLAGPTTVTVISTEHSLQYSVLPVLCTQLSVPLHSSRPTHSITRWCRERSMPSQYHPHKMVYMNTSYERTLCSRGRGIGNRQHLSLTAGAPPPSGVHPGSMRRAGRRAAPVRITPSWASFRGSPCSALQT